MVGPEKERRRKRGGRLVMALLAAAMLVAPGCALLPKTPPNTYDLTAPESFPDVRGRTWAQLLILEPSAVKVLDSQNIVIKPSDAEVEYLANSQWSDRLPKLVQARLVESFENTDRVRAVARPGDGLVIDYQMVVNIRAFQANVLGEDTGGPVARVAFSVKLVSDRTGKVVRTRVFEETVPLASTGTLDVVTGIDDAFDQAVRDLVAWTFAGI